MEFSKPEFHENRRCTVTSEYSNDGDFFRETRDSIIQSSSKNEESPKKKEKIYFVSKNKFEKSDFEIMGLIGRGAYAIVVKAKHRVTKHIFSIKIITKSFIDKENRLYQIYSEVEVLHILNHPNIIEIFGVFEEDDKVYIVLEYCENGNLMEFMKNNSIYFLFRNFSL